MRTVRIVFAALLAGVLAVTASPAQAAPPVRSTQAGFLVTPPGVSVVKAGFPAFDYGCYGVRATSQVRVGVAALGSDGAPVAYAQVDLTCTGNVATNYSAVLGANGQTTTGDLVIGDDLAATVRVSAASTTATLTDTNTGTTYQVSGPGGSAQSAFLGNRPTIVGKRLPALSTISLWNMYVNGKVPAALPRERDALWNSARELMHPTPLTMNRFELK